MWSIVALSVFTAAILPILVFICKTSGKQKKDASCSLEPRDDSREPKGTPPVETKKVTAEENQKENVIQASKQRRISVPGSPNSGQSPQTRSAQSSVRQELRSNTCMKPIPRRGGIKQNIRAPNFDLEPPSVEESKKNDGETVTTEDGEGCNDPSKSVTISRKLSHRASDSSLASEG